MESITETIPDSEVPPRRRDGDHKASHDVEERHHHDHKENRGRKGRKQQEFYQTDDE